MNQVSLVGRLVYEPELKQTNSGKNYLSTRIAVSRNDKNKTTDFINIRAWENQAKFISEYFHKGDPIGIIGKLQTESYDRQDGTKATDTFVLIGEVSFVPQKANSQVPSGNQGLPFEV